MKKHVAKSNNNEPGRKIFSHNLKTKAMNKNQKDPGCCTTDSGCCGITDMGCC